MTRNPMITDEAVGHLGPNTLRDELGRTGIMAILRYRDGGDLPAAIEAVSAGGVTVLELTVDTPGAWDAIGVAAARSEFIVGGGTVTEIAQVERLAALGARFMVSPGFVHDVVRAALDLGLEALPGVATGTEILAARRAGARLFKLFPAGALGVQYLSELRGPFGSEWFVPTGGISIDGLGDWLRSGAIAVAIGSALTGRQPPRNAAEQDALTERARRSVAAARAALDEQAGCA